MRGPPSLRIVAIVLCLWASKRCLTRSASSGAAAANSDQEAMAQHGDVVGGERPVETSKTINMCGMADRLRELIDVVLDSLDEPVNGASLAQRAHFSRDHLDRLLAAATGESPVALRRRLLLERAAWQLRTGRGVRVGGGGAARATGRWRRSRARSRGPTARRRARSRARWQLEAPNGIHFHPPAGLLIPGAARASPDLTDRLVSHHLDRVRELLAAAAALRRGRLEQRAAARVRRRLVRGGGAERVR